MAEAVCENWFAWLLCHELDAKPDADEISGEAIFGRSQADAIREVFRFILLAWEDEVIEYLMVATIAAKTGHDAAFLWGEFQATKARHEKTEAEAYRFKQKGRYERRSGVEPQF